MNQNYKFYDERAKAAEAEAEQAQLENVRERAERSAAVFRQLASQARKVEVDRAKAEQIRVERRAAEAEEASRVAEARAAERAAAHQD